MQGVIKSYDPSTGDGTLLRDTDLAEFELAGDALDGDAAVAVPLKEEAGRGTSNVVITEIPYMVQKSRLIEKLAELIDDKAGLAARALDEDSGGEAEGALELVDVPVRQHDAALRPPRRAVDVLHVAGDADDGRGLAGAHSGVT